MRLTYPNLVFASYSSSGPVRAKNDYFEYDLAVGDGLGEDCANSMAAAVEYIDSVLDTNNKTAIAGLKATFGLSNVTASNDFGSALTDAAALGVQYGNQTLIDILCKLPKYDATVSGSVSKIIDAFGGFQKAYMKEYKVDPNSYNSNFNISDKIADNDGSRQWYWQTCLEFGFWQTAPKPPLRRVRSKYITVDYYQSGCATTYGARNVPPQPQTDRINSVYQSDHISTPRIVFANGELDPWRRLSVSAPDASPRQSTLDQPVYVIKGGHHCDDLGRTTPKDSASQTEVKQKINNDIQRWLKSA